ncbi:MAG: RsmB/NOP family class I SAM-dependent RNA methyltransferase [Candidatus Phaeomarinobacter sp.]
MTPGARVAAAIEIVEHIERGERPADDVVRQWGRSHRFAGSKDRRAISSQVYSVLRRRGFYAKASSVEPRALVITDLVLGECKAPQEVAALFSGEGHAPPPLSNDEHSLINTLTSGMQDGLPAYDVPDFLLPELMEAFGDDLDTALAALDTPAPLDLRVNTLKTTREEAAAALAAVGIDTTPTPHAPTGLRVSGNHLIAGTIAFKEGMIEPMDEGSQLAALMVDAQPGMQVLDLCAGGGGKTLALAATMQNKGQIYATDTDARRLGNLAPRMRRADARNIQPMKWPQDGNFSELAGKCDRVLIDAPCSGTGAWRRHPEQKWRLTAEEIEKLTKTQDALLKSAADLVKSGGQLVYVTCSVLPSENEQRIEDFLESHADFSPVFSASDPATPANSGIHLTPHSYGTDGFFVCRLERTSTP